MFARTPWGSLIPACMMLFCCTGCFHSWINGWLNPSEIGSFDTSHSSEIRRSISVLEEPGGLASGSEPTPDDLIVHEVEYRIAITDTILVRVFELIIPSVETISQPQVDETGSIYVPEIGWLKVAGLTVRELQALIIDELRKRNILEDPQVEVAVPLRRGRVFHVFGVVGRPGTFPIPKGDFRLMEALLMAGGLTDLADQVYVFRPNEGDPMVFPDEIRSDSAPGTQFDQAIENGTDPGVDSSNVVPAGGIYNYSYSDTLLSTYDGGAPPVDDSLPETTGEEEPLLEEVPGAPAATQPDRSGAEEPMDALDADLLEAISPSGVSTRPANQETQDTESARGAVTQTAPGVSEPVQEQGQPAPLSHWIWLNGKWIEVSAEGDRGVSQTAPAIPGATMPATQRVADWDEMDVPASNRIISIPAKPLREGDARYNLVIRENDTIRITAGETGQYYIMGHIGRPGVYSLSGLKVTIKQAVAAAGGLGPLAWPDRCDVIRRIGADRETVIPVDLDRIFSGRDADFFIKPNDIINVGTHAAAPFLFSIRSAFRLTYGFGFVWDRNFGDFESQGGVANPRAVREARRAQQFPGLFP